MNCTKCGKVLQNLQKKYCSVSCSVSVNNVLFPRRKPEGACCVCKKPINTRKKYCSLACKNTLIEQHVVNCKNCGKPVGNRIKTYCNSQCMADFSYKSYIQKWLNKEISGVRSGMVTSRHIKRYLRETRGDKCERCGWNERNSVTNKVPVELEHIDGHWENNDPQNLLLLCPNCHSLTSTFKGLNRGNGRTERAQKLTVKSNVPR